MIVLPPTWRLKYYWIISEQRDCISSCDIIAAANAVIMYVLLRNPINALN